MIQRDNHEIDKLELMAYLDGELPRERASAAATHLKSCSQCEALADEFRSMSQSLTLWSVESSDAALGPDGVAALDEHVRRRERSGQKVYGVSRTWFRRKGLIAALGSGLAAVLFAMVVAPPRLMMPMREFSGAKAMKGPISSGYAPPSPAPTALSVDGQPKADSNGLFHGRGSKAVNQFTSSDKIPLPLQPMIIRTAELAIVTTALDQTRTRVEEILKRRGGYLGDLNVAGAVDAPRTLTATLRIPAGELDAAITELKALGHVRSESQKGEEVSQQYVDLQARLQNARNSEQRLTELLRRAGKLSDVLEVEEQIESVRENIERMDAEQKNLAKQVSFSTLNMQITEDYQEHVHLTPDSAGTRFRNAAVDGYETMVTGLVNLLLFLFSWGPSLVLWGALLFFPVRWLWRKVNQRA